MNDFTIKPLTNERSQKLTQMLHEVTREIEEMVLKTYRPEAFDEVCSDEQESTECGNEGRLEELELELAECGGKGGRLEDGTVLGEGLVSEPEPIEEPSEGFVPWDIPFEPEPCPIEERYSDPTPWERRRAKFDNILAKRGFQRLLKVWEPGFKPAHAEMIEKYGMMVGPLDAGVHPTVYPVEVDGIIFAAISVFDKPYVLYMKE